MRLYRTLKEIVNPSHTCLVAWDVQNRLVNSTFNREVFLHNLKSFLDAARRKAIPIVYTKITPLPMEYDSGWRTYMMMKRFKIDDPAKLAQFNRPGTPQSDINSTVAPGPEDAVIDKPVASIFIGTSFENMMRNRGIDTILFTGIATEYGIASSARDSGNRGFYTAVVSDCVSSSDRDMHDTALKTLDKVCIVATSADIMAQW